MSGRPGVVAALGKWGLNEADAAFVHGVWKRKAYGKLRVAARCPAGHPLVLQAHPIAEKNKGNKKVQHLNPVMFWLICPQIQKRISQMEAEQAVTKVTSLLEDNPAMKDSLVAAHEEHRKVQHALLSEADWKLARDRKWEQALLTRGVGGIGNPAGVKCLHAHYAHYAAGYANPIGKWVEEQGVQPCKEDAEPVMGKASKEKEEKEENGDDKADAVDDDDADAPARKKSNKVEQQ